MKKALYYAFLLHCDGTTPMEGNLAVCWYAAKGREYSSVLVQLQSLKDLIEINSSESGK